MTISSANNKSGPYNGNGVTTAFSGTFKIFDETHVQVIATDAAGAETVKTLTTHYTVSGVGGSGFTVTMLAAPALGTKITLIRDVPFTQEVDLENQGAYFAEVVEQALDAAVSRDQQLQEQVSRSVKIPASADLAALDTLIASIVLLGDSADDLAGLAAISADLETLAAINAQISTVAGISTAVSSVAAISTQVQAVAAVDDELLDIYADLAALLAVPAAAAASASAASGSATAASGSATAAAASAVAAAASAGSVTPLPNQVVAASAITFIADADLVGITETTGPTLKKITWADVKATIWTALGALIAGGTAKPTPVDADMIAIADSAASNGSKSVTLTALWTAYLKGKADALYLLIANVATAANFRANTADKILDTDGVWAAAAEVALTDAPIIVVDFSTFINGVMTLGGNRTLGNPFNEKVGQSGYIRVVQPGAGGPYTLAYGVDWEFAGGVAPTLSTAANAQDMLFYQIIATDRVLGTLVKGIA